jgi:hypothetical protein
MCAREFAEPRSAAPRVESVLAWLGGGHWRELGERHERSSHAIAGAVVTLGAALAWLVAALAVGEGMGARWPMLAQLALVASTLVFGILVGAVTRGIATGPTRGWPGVAGRVAVGIALGVVVGELAALVVFSTAIERALDLRALRTADSTPAVVQASDSLRQTRSARGSLDNAVELAREHQDQALVIARCEYHPTPACPQTRITGVPGAGPETRTANELLADAQHQLDGALAARDRQAPELDARISTEVRAVTEARQRVVANAGRGLGVRWVAMNDLTLAGAGALVLRLVIIALFALLYLLPLTLLRWRGETTHDRRSAARAERERAELDADTAIAIKRAEVRREAEIMWAEHQLTQARLAIEAQLEIDREEQRRRVLDALDSPVRAASSLETSAQPAFDRTDDDVYLPIAAEAEAASRAVAELPAAAQGAPLETPEHEPQNLPVQPEAPPIPDATRDATRGAARWIRPLVPPIVARVIDNTTQPLRTARQVFEGVYEEVEEITFALRRTRKVTFDAASSKTSETPLTPETEEGVRHAAERAGTQADNQQRSSSLGRAPAKGAGARSLGPADGRLELMERGGSRELPPG